MSELKLSALAKGLASFVPGIGSLTCSSSGGTVSARYCYASWLRILSKLYGNGIKPDLHSVAELGPGDSIGVGLCAMLSGADHYYALDAKMHAASLRNAEILEELIALFQRRSPIPDATEFPRLNPILDCYDFPDWLLGDEVLSYTLSERRLARLRELVSGRTVNDDNLSINYIAPWDNQNAIPPGTLDFLFSQAVMEHVDQLEKTYACMQVWLKENGIVAHTIDFKCHRLTKHWYGHWTVSAKTWRLVRGTRPYLINRSPHSAHTRMLSEHGFEIVLDEKRKADALPISEAAQEFTNLEIEDYETSGCFIVGLKEKM